MRTQPHASTRAPRLNTFRWCSQYSPRYGQTQAGGNGDLAPSPLQLWPRDCEGGRSRKGGFCVVYICFLIPAFWMSEFSNLSEIEQLSPDSSQASAAQQFPKPCEDLVLELKN